LQCIVKSRPASDRVQELSNALASAHPKIQKMCEEESDDHEAVAKLLEINDSIHRTVERYKLIKKGDVEAAAKIPQGTLGISGAGVKKGTDNELSLIDFGGMEDEEQPAPAPSSSTAQPAQKAPTGNHLEDDLLGLSLGGDSTYGQGAAITLGSSNGMSAMSSMAGPSQPAAPQAAQSSSFMSQPQIQQPPKANYDPFGMISSQAPSVSASPAPNLLGQQKSQQPPQQQQKAADPFAALSSTSRTASPFQYQQSTKPPPTQAQAASSLLGDLNGSSKPRASDEWTFSSSLPAQTYDITVTNSAIRAVFHVSRPAEANDWLSIESKISNNTAQQISDLTFQLAVTKVSPLVLSSHGSMLTTFQGFQLKLEPQSSRNLGPNQANGITQKIRLNGVHRGQGTSAKMRWKASYVVGTERREEQGELGSLGVA